MKPLLISGSAHPSLAAAIARELESELADRVIKDGQPLGAKVVAEALGTGKFAQIVAVDLHSPVIASSMDVPVAHVTAFPVFADVLRPMVSENSIVVAPDLGAVKLADAYARTLGLPLTVVSKLRVSPVEVAVQNVVGDVRGKRPIVVDDRGAL